MELRVEDDIVPAAVDLFLEAEPRTVALSGGSTPRPVYERLAETEYPWDEVEVFFGDERCVPPDHPDSNFRMADESLLSKVPARVHPMSDCDPEAYRKELAAVFGPGMPRFDFVFLGMGEDGHTASLFPGDRALDIKNRLVARVKRPDHPRMTFTLPVLNAARLALFLVDGASKREALAKLRAEDESIPATLVKAERVIVLADRAAVGE